MKENLRYIEQLNLSFNQLYVLTATSIIISLFFLLLPCNKLNCLMLCFSTIKNQVHVSSYEITHICHPCDGGRKQG